VKSDPDRKHVELLPTSYSDPVGYNPFSRLNLIGQSPSFLNALKVIKKIAQCDAPVLVLGETGTGKENVARAIHYLGERQDFPFIPINCGAIPDNLVENELFGHVKGAFTDAQNTQIGLIAQAEGGTIFLDEVDTLSHKAQVALLRFVQDQKHRPVGGKALQKSDVRIIAASNRNLKILADQGSFRHDLMFRLNVLDITLPPLRERTDDIEILGLHFLEHYGNKYKKPGRRLHCDTLKWMKSYDWPGNVRELENFLHRSFLLSDENLIRHADCEAPPSYETPQSFDLENSSIQWNFKRAKRQVVNEFEGQYLKNLMEKSKGNVTQASKISGKERRAIGKLLKKHGINKSHYCDPG
jgi:DNA-binding NtrC family response regulator